MISRSTAYTSTRDDIISLVPAGAKCVLDVGCSDGTLGHALKMTRPALHVVGIEMDRDFSAMAAQRLDRVVTTDLNAFQWDRISITETFDCIIFADILEHLINPTTQLTQATSFLHPNGSVIISMPNIRHITALLSIALRGTFPRRDRGIFDRTHLRWFTLSDARNMVQSANLKISAETYNLRIFDQGGGLANKLVSAIAPPFDNLSLIREFFTYQFCICATKAGIS